MTEIVENRLTLGPKNGTLIIIGGGFDNGIKDKFFELAGGKDAIIVIIPTAIEDNLIRIFARKQIRSYKKDFGIDNVTSLHTRDPVEANTEEFVKPLKKATGVVIMGGRHWRLADAYLNTLVIKELFGVLERGGLIAGSSAGATIQGSYMIRGDTKTNTILNGDHVEGFGFVKNVVIDQHVLARNRQFDLKKVLEKHPELLGIGIDENTGIIVKGNEFEVIGKSYVAIHDGTMCEFICDGGPEVKIVTKLPPNSYKFYFLGHGRRYDLKNRCVIK